MIASWWSWALFASGVFGLWLLLHKPRVGAFYNVVGQCAWFTYGVVTHQYGFLASATVYSTVYGHFIWKAYRKAKAEESETYEEIVR